jgi:hypothetical protein
VSENVAKRALSRAEAAAYLGVSVKSLDRLLLPRSYVSPRRPVYLPEDLDAHLAQTRVVPAAAAPRVLEAPRRARRVRARRVKGGSVAAFIQGLKEREERLRQSRTETALSSPSGAK